MNVFFENSFPTGVTPTSVSTEEAEPLEGFPQHAERTATPPTYIKAPYLMHPRQARPGPGEGRSGNIRLVQQRH